MPLLSNPSFGPRTALGYITGGLMLVVWTAVYFFAFVRSEEAVSKTTWFWVLGFLLTGVVLILLGVFLGPIGRMARHTELPPEEALRAETAIQQTAAAHPAPVVPAAGEAVAPAGAGQPAAAQPVAAAPAGQSYAPGATGTASAPTQPIGPPARR